ncbi:hypothetical protein OPT61_g4864 [Boeremia exigua]|uniref:Uncharacterized protein n=1 Tax=Boeremia exigua TaxID=749465 RepID=A0ACC2ICH6_9PLEO|nr:hypothetical protein OPT61_g4864 [Boeremia exigua]
MLASLQDNGSPPSMLQANENTKASDLPNHDRPRARIGPPFSSRTITSSNSSTRTPEDFTPWAVRDRSNPFPWRRHGALS